MERKIFYIAIYIRLSKEDADIGFDESESIKNQRTLLIDYVKKLGPMYKIVDLYIDHGYTGTNFNRPAFKRMIQDINLGKINMVITKDLSRLGRDYIETGEYIEKWFPEKNVRYISVTDGIDTFSENNGNNDIAPFKAILNDMYSKDLSKKIRTALHTMQAQGKWVGGKTALGYKNNKNKLVICEDEAKIVKLIFDMAYKGENIGAITKYLNENKIPTASQIRYNENTLWSSRTVKRILVNPVYIGTTIQNKKSRISYKNRKLVSNPREQWYIIENTHEAIIEKDIFDKIQKMKITQQYARNEKKNFILLDNLMICYECKHKMGIKKGKNNCINMLCSYYRRFSRLKVCTAHGFNYNKFEITVLNYIRKLFLNINCDKVKLNILKMNNNQDYIKIQEKIKNEILLINENIDKMYIDKLNNLISSERYDRLLNKLKSDISKKERSYCEIEKLKNTVFDYNANNIKTIIENFLKLDEPKSEFMRMIINRIEIHQNKQIDIIFNFKKVELN